MRREQCEYACKPNDEFDMIRSATLNFSPSFSDNASFLQNIHLQPIAFFPFGNFTNSQVLFFCNDSISFDIATSHLSLSFLFVASLKVNGSPLLVTRAKLIMSSKPYLCGAL